MNKLLARAPWLFPALFCVGGLLMAHHPMLKEGFGYIQFDPGDTRFCNYLLEHDWRWLLGKTHHEDLWSPPYFYPAKGALAWAENMIGAVPFYGIWRVLGFEVDTSFQLWILTLGVFNFLATYFFLRRCVKADIFAASVGAALFSFAGMRVNQTMHYQLFPHFFSVWAVHAAWRLLEDIDTLTQAQRARWIFAFCAAVVGQILVGIYLGWYLVFGFTWAFVGGMLFSEGRRRVFKLLKDNPFTIALAGALSLGILLPVATKYLGTEKDFGGRPFWEALSMIPPVQAWLHFGNWSWWYAGLAKLPFFQGIPMDHEQRLGFGFIVIPVGLAGMVLARRDKRFLYLAGLLFFFIAITTLYSGYQNPVTPWKYIYEYFPGAKAIRAVCRIALLYLMLVSVFVAVALTKLREKSTALAALAVVLGFGCIIEQGETTAAFSKWEARRDVQAIVKAVGPECDAFYYSPLDGRGPYWKYQLDGMMAQLEVGIPTLNGYSGQLPKGYEIMNEPNIREPQDEPRIAKAASEWIAQNRLQANVCWAKVGLSEGPLRSQFISQTVPAQVRAGQRFPVELRFKNTGEVPWRPEQNFRLGALSPRDSRTWGTPRVALPSVVEPGGEALFQFEAVAPGTQGTWPFQWRLVVEGVTWFGETSPPLQVSVAPAP